MKRHHTTPAFDHPDKLHCADPKVAALITKGRYAPAPTIFEEPDETQYPFWLFAKNPNDYMDPGTRTALGCLIHGPITISVGDSVMFEGHSHKISAIVSWSNIDDIVVEYENTTPTTLDVALIALQIWELHYTGQCQADGP